MFRKGWVDEFVRKTNKLGIGKGCFNLITYITVSMYTSYIPVFHERKSMSFFNFIISQEMGLDRGAQDAGMAFKSCFWKFWTRKSPISKGKIIFQTPSFCMSILVFRFFGSVLFWKGLSCSDRFSSWWWYCSTIFHVFYSEDFHPICLFLPTKPITIGANIRCILVYPLPVFPDHEHLRVPCPMLPPRLK